MRWLRAFLMLSLTLALLPTHFIAAQTLVGEIVFTSDRDGGFSYEGELINTPDIYVMQADGSNTRKLTDTGTDAGPDNPDWFADNSPTWSPDGQRILFGRYYDGCVCGDLYVMNADGSGLRVVIPEPNEVYNYTEPSWSPDSHHVIYTNQPFTELVVLNPSREYGDYFDQGSHPDWSPNGQQIVYVSDSEPNHDLLVNSTGGNGQNLTNGVGDNLDPVWSPDGTKIAFASNRAGNYEIYVMNANGSGVVRLTNNTIEDREPAWSPDGTKIAFTRTFADGNAEIFVMNVNGSNQANLTNNPGHERHPDWKAAGPAGKRTLLISSNSDGKVGGITFKDEDILAYDLQSHQWSMYFDGSDVGISKDVDGLAVAWDGSLVLSFNATTKVPGVGLVSDADLVLFTPTRLGATTAGTFMLKYTGATYGLTTADEDIDAVTVIDAYNIDLSTVGDFALTIGDQNTGKDEDLIGIYSDYGWNDYYTGIDLDGSMVGLTTGKEDISGVSYYEGVFYLSVLGTFAVPGVTGDGADIFKHVCNGDSCVFQPEWDGSAAGFGQEVIDAFEYVNMATPPVTAATIEDIGDDPYAGIDDEYADDEQGEAETFLPLVQR